jgi:ketosteroid isomerase-like protein
MSEENVEAFKRALEAGNRRDFDALLEELDSEVEWHPAMEALLGGKATVYRGREGARQALQDLFDSFAELHLKISGVRNTWAYLLEFKNGKAIWVRAFLDPREALEAAGLLK